ncbi:MAG: RNA polymerase sigma factor [Marmoricola sp.]
MPTLDADQAAVLVKEAASGSQDAWDALVDAYGGLVWSIARRDRLSPGDAADVSQTTWLRLIEHVDRLNDPARVGAWLATTARRECIRVSSRNRRALPTGDDYVLERPAETADPDADLLRNESAESVQWALRQLPERSQQLLEWLMREPPVPYAEISRALDIPIGSIGPTRGRCLRKLRAVLDSQLADYR